MASNNNKKIDRAEMRNRLLEAALRYARRKWAVIPVHSVNDGQCTCGKNQCENPGKHPRTMNGLKDAAINEDIIGAWWEKWPDANVAVVTGASSGLVTLDVDPRNGGEESLNKLLNDKRPPKTSTVSTGGGGIHFHFACPADGLKSRSSILPGLDIKANGGYVLMPPSVHRSGKRYGWAQGLGIEEVGLAAMPQWLTELSVSQKKSPSKTAAKSQPIPEGERHDSLLRMAGSLRRNGLGPKDILAVLVSVNKTRCKPPLPEKEVIAMAESTESWPSVTSASNPSYEQSTAGLFWLKPTKDGPQIVKLANFQARIVSEIREDDGIEERVSYEIMARVLKRSKRFTVPAAQFATLNWAAEHLGASAIVSPGMGLRDHTRAAIQELSGPEIERQRIFTHAGWRKYGGGYVYLHGEGAISEDGLMADAKVRLPESLAPFKLPAPPDGERLKEAIRASLEFLKIGAPRITFPIYGGIFRAVMGPCDCSLAIVGPTGAGKSEAAALAQQHYGGEFNARKLPGSWSGTANANEALAFAAKDMLLVLDDFAPAGTQGDLARYNRDADRILRAQGNASGRLRMRRDATLSSAKVPRGLILSTGEDLPRGQSLRARMFVVELSTDALNWDGITKCQGDASAGLYSETMSAFLQWLAPEYEYLRKILPRELAALRAKATSSNEHKRTPEIVANLMLGLKYFFLFAKKVGAISKDEANDLEVRAWQALGSAAKAQSGYQKAEDPVIRFLELIRSALATRSAGLGDAGTGNFGDGKKNCIGWISDDVVFLDPDAAFATAQKLAKEQGEFLTITAKAQWQRMRDRGLLVASEPKRNLIKVKIGKSRRRVVALACETLGVVA